MFSGSLVEKCVPDAEIPGYLRPSTDKHIGIDPDASVKTVKECQVDNCMNCITDYRTCEECLGIFYLKELNGVYECVSTIPDQWGLDLTASLVNKIKPCQISNCLTCSDDYTICNQCESSFYQKPIAFNSYDCLQRSEIGDGWGIAPTGMTLIPCQVQDCVSCVDDYSKCGLCLDPFCFDASSTNTCIDPEQSSKFIGVDGSCADCDASCKIYFLIF